MKSFEYAVAESKRGIAEATSRGYAIKANGIDLLDMLKERIAKEDKYVSIGKVDSLRGIKREGDAVVILPLTTLKEIGENEMLKKEFPGLAHAAGEAATPQVRAKATAGGNLCQRPRCWYFRSKEYDCLKKGGARCFAVDGDNTYHAIFGEGPCHIIHPSSIAPPLVAAGAEVDLETSDGKKRTVKLAEFFEMPQDNIYGENVLEDGELMTAIRIPKMPEKSSWIEFREKASFDWPLAACSAAMVDGKWNVVLGMVAPVPWKSEAAEKALEGANSIDDALAEKAANAAVEDADPMTMNAFRVRLARAAVRRALLQADGKEYV